MRKVFLTIIVFVVSGVFTSCTDLEEKVVPEQELQNITGNGDTGNNDDTGGEEDPIEEEDL
ncbi:hypothetical protein [uncultured Tenacibaculum sp.]|uniref:hypothetical protein n=1 Tax=uncultured Tenacibaculum sp. TaxID=174713 RepID=UPI002603E8D6|nr:hypothetical protein [uncultured Tenacibaculum sp.]